MQAMERIPSLSSFVGALNQTGLASNLTQQGPFTVLAPDNDAFANAVLPTNRTALIDLLGYHILRGNLTLAQLRNGTMAASNGQNLTVFSLLAGQGNASITINDAAVIAGDIVADNGIVDIVDQVLVPDSESLSNATNSSSGSGDEPDGEGPMPSNATSPTGATSNNNSSTPPAST